MLGGALSVVNVYMGFDTREERAYEVAAHSLIANSSRPVNLQPLILERLRKAGLIRRPIRHLEPGRSMIIRGGQISREAVTESQRGTLFDVISSAPMATEFAISRFLVPMLNQTGWALFVDCDVVFLGNVAELFDLARNDFAVMCVKHGELAGEGLKMDGQRQIPYNRKNWSSVALFNCSHPAHRRLTLEQINNLPGRDLHRFFWLNDEEIGALPAEWNWLVNVQQRPPAPKIAHYTLGGPWLPGWKGADNDTEWLRAESDLGSGYRADLTQRSGNAMQDGSGSALG
jgi:hypothetical protein